ncbi:gamma-glutamylcyclotransferase [Actinomadura viridis]|uniref:gamma-glutamylcyclotransferase family protein n=1 Tax=Actinomadura viridis TaxID=58110 RepID=UPI0036B4B9CA
MAHTDSQLPVFVYGTLRRGEGNHRLLVPHAVAIHPAELTGHRLYSQGLPYVASGDAADAVVGEIVRLNPQTYDIAMKQLDGLEGVDHGMYRREALPVRFRCDCAPQQMTSLAWVYLGGNGFFDYSPHLVVPGGDWVSARRSADYAAGCA